MISRFILLVLFVCQTMIHSSSLLAQDTIWTNVFNYQSGTRDTFVQFPEGDHTQYEKILMYYSMRCKKGLVSTASNRNLGCGEWDYSCNTNVVDSSATDSLKATHPNFIISGYPEDFFPYTTVPAYTLHRYPAKPVTGQSGMAESAFAVGPLLNRENLAMQDQTSSTAYYIYHKNELAGLTSGNIAGLRLFNEGPGSIDHMIMKIANLTNDDFSLENLSGLPFNTVVERKITFDSQFEDILFTKPFSYSANSHIVISVQYFGKAERLSNLKISFDVNPEASGFANIQDQYLQMGSQGVALLPGDQLKTLKNEISVSFWSRGNSAVLPNNNSVFYATDAAGNRQLNVHLPWSNGRVFWDSGFGAGSFDRIDKAAIPSEYEGAWSHWVFTKNVQTGSMKIYLNGALWHSGTGKTKGLDIQKFYLGGNQDGGLLYNGDLDDFCVWNKELTADEVAYIMMESPAEGDNLFPNLMAHYDMNRGQNNEINDRSSYNQKASFSDQVSAKRFAISEIFKGYSRQTNRPSVSFIKGSFVVTTGNTVVADSILNPPYQVTAFAVEGSNLVEKDTRYLWFAGFYPVYDENGEQVDETEYPEEDVIIIEPLTYYRKFPAKYELLSFVTPYGIGLDFGLKGKTWVFDVTDYGPVLKGGKRFFLDKGGEWQEEMDIRFAFIKGVPSRPVLSVHQIWPAESYGFTSILNNSQLEPRVMTVEPDVASMKIRTVATGHGQEGEFIPRMHSLLVQNTFLSWQLWTECADNPVYPQGGTWVYDRAGWCPGAPSDLREFEIMPMVGSANTFTVDYGLNTAAGDSRYIVNTQLVKYGQPSFSRDASIEEIIAPSPAAVHFRKNPVCANPEFVLKNNGTDALQTVVIGYKVEGGTDREFTWTGNLGFLQTQKVQIPGFQNHTLWDGGLLSVWIKSVNGVDDEYAKNNLLTSPIEKTKVFTDGIIVSMRTNGAPGETSWTLEDENKNVIKRSRTNLLPNTLYNDTIRNLAGCYKLQFRDTDDDGISWWANGDGNGTIRAKGINDNAFTIFQPDFGREFTFSFVAVSSISTDAPEAAQSFSIQPNPGSDLVKVIVPSWDKDGVLRVIDNAGNELVRFGSQGVNLQQNEFTVDVAAWPSGVYLFQYTGKNRVMTNRFIKI